MCEGISLILRPSYLSVCHYASLHLCWAKLMAVSFCFNQCCVLQLFVQMFPICPCHNDQGWGLSFSWYLIGKRIIHYVNRQDDNRTASDWWWHYSRLLVDVASTDLLKVEFCNKCLCVWHLLSPDLLNSSSSSLTRFFHDMVVLGIWQGCCVDTSLGRGSKYV